MKRLLPACMLLIFLMWGLLQVPAVAQSPVVSRLYAVSGGSWVAMPGDATNGVTVTCTNCAGGGSTTADVNLKQVAGATVSTGHGTATGAIRVELPTDGTGLVTVAQAVAASLNATIVGTGTFATQSTLQTGSNQIGHLEANQSVNVAQMNGVTTTMGNGIAGTGVQRVAIASDNTAFSVNAVQSGTWTVQPGNTANTTAWLVKMNDGTNSALVDPCAAVTKTTVAISQTASTKLISQQSAKKNYICSIVIVTGTAEIVNIVEGTGSTCGTNTAAIVGSTTAANGLSFATNGGMSANGGSSTIIAGTGTNVDTCLTQSASNRVSGYLTYVQL